MPHMHNAHPAAERRGGAPIGRKRGGAHNLTLVALLLVAASVVPAAGLPLGGGRPRAVAEGAAVRRPPCPGVLGEDTAAEGVSVDARCHGPRPDAEGGGGTQTSADEQPPGEPSADTIDTAVGGGDGDGGSATAASLSTVTWVAASPRGEVFVTDRGNSQNRVRRIDSAGVIRAGAGNGAWELLGDGGPAELAAFASPDGIAFDAVGNLYIADPFNMRVRKVGLDGIVSTIAGSTTGCPCPFVGTGGFSGDGGPATEAELLLPSAITADPEGNVYFYDSGNHRVRKIDTAGVITTVAGNGESGCSGGFDDLGNWVYGCEGSGDGGPATEATIPTIKGLVADGGGNLYISSEWAQRIRKVDAEGIITTIAGDGEQRFSGDGGPASEASLNFPGPLALDAAGNLFVSDRGNNRVRKVDTAGIITTVAGNGTRPDCLMAGRCPAPEGDGGPATSSSVGVHGVTVDRDGNLYIGDYRHRRVRKVDTRGIITTIAGNGYRSYAGDGMPARAAGLNKPAGASFDSAGNLYIADSGNHRVRRVDAASGIITTIAGNGTAAFAGDGGDATDASLNNPVAVAADRAGNVYIADFGNARVRKVSPEGTITTYAGTGAGHRLFGVYPDPCHYLDPIPGMDRGPATGVCMVPASVTVNDDGDLFVADYAGNRVHKVDGAVSADGAHHVSTYAGTGSRACVGATCPTGNGDGGPATQARLDTRGLALDADGNLFVASQAENRVRHVDATPAADGARRISTVAGDGRHETAGDGGPATAAAVKWPVGLAVDSERNLYIQQKASEGIFGGYATRKVDASGMISTIAGGCRHGRFFFSGDGAPATQACVSSPHGLATDTGGSLYIADAGNDRIRVVRSR